jgi:hypothetical protein
MIFITILCCVLCVFSCLSLLILEKYSSFRVADNNADGAYGGILVFIFIVSGILGLSFIGLLIF